MDRDIFFVFGSVCRLMATKIPPKDWQAYADAIWTWSRKKVEKQEPDVPDFTPSNVLPPPPHNGSPVPDLPPPAEKPVKVPDPAPIPVEEKVVYLNDDQIMKFVAHATRQGFSEMSLIRFLRDRGYPSVQKVPLGKAGLLWEALKNPEVQQQYQ